MTTQERRAELLKWISTLPDREGMTAPEIAREAVAWLPHRTGCIYDINERNVVHLCLEDLVALERQDKLQRRGRAPVTWWTH
jgi:hypothetical protein